MARAAIAQKVAQDIESASWIREMFEKGIRLKQEHGADNVFDLSLGNPNAVPPIAFFDALETVARERSSQKHRYMPNAGYPETRSAIARFLSREYELDFSSDGVIVTCGAAGAMNVTLRSICDPGDEVIVLSPFFPEYRFYIEQANATPVFVDTDEQFQPDCAKIEAAITSETRAIIVNSPNNPTGAIYAEATLRALGELLSRFDRDDRPLYLICDDPYKRILFDAPHCASAVQFYDRSILCSSYSKDLSIAGERLGYIGLPSAIPQRALLAGAMTMLNRTLGFVNAPAVTQRTIERCADAMCDISAYRANRDRLCTALREFGYDLMVPGGAMFAFPKTPTDDVAFTELLVQERVLVVPGRGFGRAGHVRVSFAVEPAVIEGSLPGFQAAMKKARG